MQFCELLSLGIGDGITNTPTHKLKLRSGSWRGVNYK